MGAMRDAGIDAFIANSTTELAMCNLVGIPTVSVPIGYGPAPGAASNSTRKNPVTVGFFGWPNGEPEVSITMASVAMTESACCEYKSVCRVNTYLLLLA